MSYLLETDSSLKVARFNKRLDSRHVPKRHSLIIAGYHKLTTIRSNIYILVIGPAGLIQLNAETASILFTKHMLLSPRLYMTILFALDSLA